MKFVYICSPLRGDIERNLRKASGYCLFAVKQATVPIAPHVMFASFLDEAIPEERNKGMSMGLELLKRCHELWVFGARLSEGMEAELRAAQQLKLPVKYFNDRCEEVLDHE